MTPEDFLRRLVEPASETCTEVSPAERRIRLRQMHTVLRAPKTFSPYDLVSVRHPEILGHAIDAPMIFLNYVDRFYLQDAIDRVIERDFALPFLAMEFDCRVGYVAKCGHWHEYFFCSLFLAEVEG